MAKTLRVLWTEKVMEAQVYSIYCVISFFLSFFFFLATPRGMQNFPDQGLNLSPLQWKPES